MPLTDKGRTIMTAMVKQYGHEKATQVFHAAANKGTITGVHGKKKKKGRTLLTKGRDHDG